MKVDGFQNVSRQLRAIEKRSQATEDSLGNIGDGADRGAKKVESAGARIIKTLAGVRKDADRGAEFGVRANVSSLAGTRRMFADVRKDASRGADFEVRGDSSGLSSLRGVLASLRSDADDGATFRLKALLSGFSGIPRVLSRIRADAQDGATFRVNAEQSGFAAVVSALGGIDRRAAEIDRRWGDSVTIHADADNIDEVVAQLRRLGLEATRVNDTEVDIGVDLDDANARVRLEALQALVRSMSGQGVRIVAGFDDAIARARMAEFERRIDSLDGRSVDIDADASRLGAFSAALRGVGSAVRGMDAGLSAGGVRIAMIGGIAATAAALFTPLLGALASLGALGASAGLGIGLIFGPLAAVTTKLGEYHEVASDAESTTAELAEAAEGLSPAMLGLYDTFIKFRGAADRVFMPAQNAISELAARVLNDVIPAFGILNRTSVATIGALGRAWDGFVSRLEMPTQQASVGTLLGITPQIVQSLTTAVGDFGLALLNILAAAAPSAARLAESFQSAMRAFLGWSGSTSGVDAVKSAIAAAVPVFQALWRMVKQAGAALFQFGVTNAPAIATAIDIISRALTAVINGFSWLTRVFGPIVPIVAALTPVFLGLALIFGQVGSLVVSLVSGFGLLAGGFTAAATALGIGTAPLLGIVVALGALAAGLAYAYARSEKFREIVGQVAGVVKDVLAAAFRGVVDDLVPLGNFLKDVGGALGQGAIDGLKRIGGHLSDLFGNEKIKSGAKSIKEALTPPSDSAWNSFVEKVRQFFGWLEAESQKEGTGVNKIWTKLTDDEGAIDRARARWSQFTTWLKGTTAFPGLQNIWQKLTDDKGAIDNAKKRWQQFKTWLSGAMKIPGVQSIWTKLTDDKGAIDRLRSRWSQFWGWLGNLWRTKTTQLTTTVQGWRTKVQTAFNSLTTGARAKWSQFWTWLSNLWRTKTTQLTNTVQKWRTRVQAAFNSLTTGARAKWSQFWTWLSNLWRTKTTQLTNTVQKWRTRVQAAFNSLTTGARAKWSQFWTWLSNLWRTKTTQLTNTVQGWRSKVQAAFSQLGEWSRRHWDAFWTWLSNLWRTKTAQVATTVQGWREKVQGIFSALDQYLTRKAQETWKNITSAFDSGKERATEIVDNLKQRMMEVFNSLPKPIQGIFQQIRDFMVNPIGDAVVAIQGFLTDLVGLVNKVLEAVGIDPIEVDFGGSSGGGSAPQKTPSTGSPVAMAKGGVTTDPNYGTAFAKGGMGTKGRNPRTHLWNEQMGNEAYIAEKRPAKEQLPYLRTAADWHGYAVIPSNPAKAVGPNYRDFAGGGLAPAAAFAVGGFPAAEEMHAAVLDKFGVDGFNNHASYLSEPAASRSIDWMVTTPGTVAAGADKTLGDNIASFVQPPSAYNTIWFGQANWGNGWEPLTGAVGIGNQNTLDHMDHIHAQAHSGSFEGGMGTGGIGGNSGISVPNPMQILFEKMWGATIKPLVDRVLKPLEGSENVMLKAAGEMARKVPEGVYKWIDEKISDTIGGTGDGDGDSGPYKGGGNLDEWAKNGLILGNVFPPSSSNIEKIKSRAMQESGGDPSAVNEWDSNAAAGTPSKGLMQVIEPTWNSNTTDAIGQFASNWSDPVKSVGVASRYMDSQYGYVVGATGQGYEKGGMALGPQLMSLAEKGKELVLPLENAQVMRSAQTALGTSELRGEMASVREELSAIRSEGIRSHITGMDDAPAGKLVAGTRSQVREILNTNEFRRTVSTGLGKTGDSTRRRGGR